MARGRITSKSITRLDAAACLMVSKVTPPPNGRNVFISPHVHVRRWIPQALRRPWWRWSKSLQVLWISSRGMFEIIAKQQWSLPICYTQQTISGLNSCCSHASRKLFPSFEDSNITNNLTDFIQKIIIVFAIYETFQKQSLEVSSKTGRLRWAMRDCSRFKQWETLQYHSLDLSVILLLIIVFI